MGFTVYCFRVLQRQKVHTTIMYIPFTAKPPMCGNYLVYLSRLTVHQVENLDNWSQIPWIGSVLSESNLQSACGFPGFCRIKLLSCRQDRKRKPHKMGSQDEKPQCRTQLHEKTNANLIDNSIICYEGVADCPNPSKLFSLQNFSIQTEGNRQGASGPHTHTLDSCLKMRYQLEENLPLYGYTQRDLLWLVYNHLRNNELKLCNADKTTRPGIVCQHGAKILDQCKISSQVCAVEN